MTGQQKRRCTRDNPHATPPSQDIKKPLTQYGHIRMVKNKRRSCQLSAAFIFLIYHWSSKCRHLIPPNALKFCPT